MKEAFVLNETIKQSEEYKAYSEALEKVKRDGQLYDAMNSFRRRNYELQGYDDGINRYNEIHNLALEYEKVLRHPDVNEFLVAEQIFSRKMKEIYEIISDGIEVDYDYMQ